MRRHRTDVLSLVFALIFLGAVAWYLLGGAITLPALGWFVAAVLILVGVAGLVGTVRSTRAARTNQPVTAPPGPPESAGSADADDNAERPVR